MCMHVLVLRTFACVLCCVCCLLGRHESIHQRIHKEWRPTPFVERAQSAASFIDGFVGAAEREELGQRQAPCNRRAYELLLPPAQSKIPAAATQQSWRAMLGCCCSASDSSCVRSMRLRPLFFLFLLTCFFLLLCFRTCSPVMPKP